MTDHPFHFARRRHAMRYELGLPASLRKNIDRDFLREMWAVARKRRSPLLCLQALYEYGLVRLFGAKHWSLP